MTKYTMPVGTRTVYARMMYEIAAGETNVGVVKKTFRFRGWENSTTEQAAGTINIQNGQFLFSGDTYSQTPYNIPQISTTVATHGPNSFIGARRCLEGMVSYPGGGVQIAKLWVDGTIVLDYTGDLLSPAGPSNPPDNTTTWYLKNMYYLDTYNASQARVEWIDSLVLSDSYIGLP